MTFSKFIFIEAFFLWEFINEMECESELRKEKHSKQKLKKQHKNNRKIVLLTLRINCSRCNTFWSTSYLKCIYIQMITYLSNLKNN